MTDMTLFGRHEVATVAECRIIARSQNWRTTNWRRIARKIADQAGIFVVFRCDDTMVVFENIGGKVCQRSHKPGTWRFV